MTLKYEGDKVTRVGNGGGSGGGDTVGYLFKMFFGSDPSQWVRFVIVGGAIVWAVFQARDFVREMKSESLEWRRAFSDYVASNEKDKAANSEERAKLIKRADVRFRRLYEHNGWEYQGLTE